MSFREYVGATMMAGMTLTAMLPSVAAAATLEEALSGGKARLDVRYRYEYVDQNNSLKNANASTVRSRLGYGSSDFHGVTAYLEFENITAVGGEDYNSGANGKTSYSVVADPEGTEVNQAYLAWRGLPATQVKYGRQRIILDNQRFVGSVGWRQNEQTFDAFSIVNSSLPDMVATYAHLTNANRITGTNAEMRSDLLNVSYGGIAAGKLTGYVYLLDYLKSASQSTQTLGLRFSGATALGEASKLLYALEYAQQGDYGKNPASYTLNYSLAEVGGMVSGITGRVGYEVLEGDGTHSVQTPLATLHAFNGWADQFLSTPAKGLQDVYLSVGGALAGVKLLAAYHDFTADKGGDDYGKEWDLQALKKINKIYTLIAKFASYSAGAAAGKVDTNKLWLAGQLSF
jgi:hypothetical protein